MKILLNKISLFFNCNVVHSINNSLDVNECINSILEYYYFIVNLYFKIV